jgi:NAD(P)-dependent dehydrogenase (short-subunit alcohol dehydrogenase family)
MTTTPVVLITGALTGIGHATAVAYAQQGANVVVSGRHQDAGDTLAEQLRERGANSEFVRADVRHEDEVEDLVDRALDRFGRLDVAVNNAGTEGQRGPVTDVTAEMYAGTFDTNVLGTLLSMKHEFHAMQPRGGGSIVNISSIYGQMGLSGAALYVGSKAAVIGMTKAAALEGAASGIRVNAVAPGFTRTAMYERTTGSDDTRAYVDAVIPQHRAGTPEEIAQAIIYVGSDEASYLTGQTITLDGGLMAGWPLFPGT